MWPDVCVTIVNLTRLLLFCTTCGSLNTPRSFVRSCQIQDRKPSNDGKHFEHRKSLVFGKATRRVTASCAHHVLVDVHRQLRLRHLLVGTRARHDAVLTRDQTGDVPRLLLANRKCFALYDSVHR